VTAARSLGGYAGHSRKYSYSFVTIRKLLSGAMQSAAYEGSSAVTPRWRMRHNPPKSFDHRDRVERRRRRGEARRMSLLFGLDFQKVPPTPTSKINLKGRVVV
jgi:hypothetical protein